MRFFQIKLFALSTILTLLVSIFDILYPTISFIVAFFIFYFFINPEFKFYFILISGFLFDGFFNFNFGTCNLIFLTLIFFDLVLKKKFSINVQQKNYYYFLLIILAHFIFILLNPLSQNIIFYLPINSFLSIIYLLILENYAK